MRASLFLVAALALSACSSPVASPSANPQTLNPIGRLVRADPGVDRFEVWFENPTDDSFLVMNALPFSCIISVTPSRFTMGYLKALPVVIEASIVDRCAHDTAEVDFQTKFYSRLKPLRWDGSLDMWHNPEKDEWTAKIRGDGSPICPDPTGLEKGVRLEELEHILFFWCST